MPLFAFSANLAQFTTPIEVVDGLHAAVQQVKEFRGVYHVLGAWYLSRVITDPAWTEGATLFWQSDFAKDFPAAYFKAYHRHGPSPTQQLARSSSRPFTFTEASRLIQTTGDGSWVFDLIRSFGMRDGLYCPFPRWAIVYLSPQPIVRDGGMSFAFIQLAGAAYLAHLRIDQLVPHPEHYERKGKNVTKRELEVLRLAANGMTHREIATALAISDRTVEHVVDSAKQRLGAKTLTEAVAQALRYKLLV